MYWRVVGCAQRINGFGYKTSEFVRFKYPSSARNYDLCFWEGDQHDKDRYPALIVTKIDRATPMVTLRAVVDLRMGYLPEES